MNTIKLFIRSILWALLIAFVLFLPGNAVERINILPGNIDKAVHFFLFLILEFMVLFDARIDLNQEGTKKFNLTFIVICYAVFTEVFQNLITSRDGNIYDFMADMAGIIAGWLAYIFFGQKIIRFFQKK